MTAAIDAPRLTLILGGVRAGKSAHALTLARSYERSNGVVFVATAQPFDDEMRRRIAAHRAERPPHWETLESPVDVASDLERLLAENTDQFDVIVIDCLTLWVSNLLLPLDEAADAEGTIAQYVTELLRVITSSSSTLRWILVSNEVGLGIVPPTALGRRYRDALGRVNQLVAAGADRVSLMVAGIHVPIKWRRDG